MTGSQLPHGFSRRLLRALSFEHHGRPQAAAPDHGARCGRERRRSPREWTRASARARRRRPGAWAHRSNAPEGSNWTIATFRASNPRSIRWSWRNDRTSSPAAIATTTAAAVSAIVNARSPRVPRPPRAESSKASDPGSDHQPPAAPRRARFREPAPTPSAATAQKPMTRTSSAACSRRGTPWGGSAWRTTRSTRATARPSRRAHAAAATGSRPAPPGRGAGGSPRGPREPPSPSRRDRGAHQEQGRHVHPRNDEYQPRGGEEEQQHGSTLADDRVKERLDHHAHGRVVLRERSAQPAMVHFELRPRLLERYPRRHCAKQVEQREPPARAVEAAVPAVEKPWDRRPEIRAQWVVESGWGRCQSRAVTTRRRARTDGDPRGPDRHP